MDFSKIKSLFIKGKKVKNLSINGKKVWAESALEPAFIKITLPEGYSIDWLNELWTMTGNAGSAPPDTTEYGAIYWNNALISSDSNTVMIPVSSDGELLLPLGTGGGFAVQYNLEGISGYFNDACIDLPVGKIFNIYITLTSDSGNDWGSYDNLKFVLSDSRKISGTWQFDRSRVYYPDVYYKGNHIGRHTLFFVTFLSNALEWNSVGYYDTANLYYGKSGSDYTKVFDIVENKYWADQEFRTITFDGEQIVSKNFYDWLNDNAVKQEEDYTIPAGTYVFNETLSGFYNQSGIDLLFNFSSNGNSYSSLSIEADPQIITMKYDNTYVVNSFQWVDGTNSPYRTITVETPQEVPQKFYDWFIENILITFTIDSTSYQAKNGMTWGEWVNSDYNTGGYVVDSSGHIILNGESMGNSVVDPNNGVYSVYANEVIIPNNTYLYGSHGGGSN